jgi:hypothetical protein
VIRSKDDIHPFDTPSFDNAIDALLKEAEVRAIESGPHQPDALARVFYSQMFIKCKESLKKIVVSSGFRLEKELILRRITGCDSTES